MNLHKIGPGELHVGGRARLLRYGDSVHLNTTTGQEAIGTLGTVVYHDAFFWHWIADNETNRRASIPCEAEELAPL